MGIGNVLETIVISICDGNFEGKENVIWTIFLEYPLCFFPSQLLDFFGEKGEDFG